MQIWWIEPSVEYLQSAAYTVVRKAMNWLSLISPEAMANSRCLTRPKPDTLPSIFTLYGGSVKTNSALSSSISSLYVAASVESPQTRMCFPSIQTSPNRLTGGPSVSSGKEFSGCSLSSPTPSKMMSTSAGSKPVKSTSKPKSTRPCSSIARTSLSQPAFSARRLSARI
jgi:hypothetical protein